MHGPAGMAKSGLGEALWIPGALCPLRPCAAVAVKADPFDSHAPATAAKLGGPVAGLHQAEVREQLPGFRKAGEEIEETTANRELRWHAVLPQFHALVNEDSLGPVNILRPEIGGIGLGAASASRRRGRSRRSSGKSWCSCTPTG